MLCASQMIPIPLQSAVGTGDSAGRRSSLDGGFSEILGKSMHAVQKTGTEKQQSRHNANYAVSSFNVSKPQTKLQTRAERSASPSDTDSPVEKNIASGNQESISGAVDGEKNRGKTSKTKLTLTVPGAEPDDELPPDSLEFLQLLLNDILVLLQKFYQSGVEPDGIENYSAKVNLEDFKQQILIKLTEVYEFVKTSDIPELDEVFADKLLQALNNGLFETESIGGEQIFIKFLNDIDSLVRKMLSETETIKLQITEESSPEFTAGSTVNSTEDIVHEQTDQPGQTKQTDQTELVSITGSKPSEEQTADIVKKNDPGAETEPHQEQSRMDTSKVSASVNRDTEQDFIVNTGIAGAPAEVSNETASSVQSADKPPAAGFQQMEKFEYRIIRQVIEKAETMLSENRTEMVIRLKPDSLGKLTLRVIHERGEITAGLIAENEQVKAVIESNLRFLEDSLRRSGVELQSLAVSVGQNGQSGQNEGDERSYRERTIGRKTPVLSPALINDAHNTYRYEGTAEGLIQMESPAIDLTA